MSTSDSDWSIDWLASDDDDSGSPKTLSPQREEEPPPSPSNSSSRATRRKRRRRRSSDHCGCGDGGRCGVRVDSATALRPPALSPVQGFTSVYTQQTIPVEQHPTRKRTRGAGSDGFPEEPQADSGNEFFSQKCVELQCYIQPLSSILQGLRSGRYSERLSSFQESVAMDRIQRIMGVLQNPNTSGRFLHILLKVEGMLQSWFPHVKPSRADDITAAKKQKQHHQNCTSSSCSSSSDVAPPLAVSYSSTHLKWLHTSPICSLKTPLSWTQRRRASSASPLPARRRQEVTQDNAVSSSTDLQPRLSRGPPPFKISSPCLERLLQAKESIIAPRTAGGGGGGGSWQGGVRGRLES